MKLTYTYRNKYNNKEPNLIPNNNTNPIWRQYGKNGMRGSDTYEVSRW
ncbi:hypothetical protein E2C01_064355 [Portunus trituberculatus]|uniref:Uncharacterized protein n=1 Tax=Portunus trituberculatus TaxID=210409 RepID=A0A5B7HJI9_PORTR|nr:hypothetical protein [Portunus trituberculatus]